MILQPCWYTERDPMQCHPSLAHSESPDQVVVASEGKVVFGKRYNRREATHRREDLEQHMTKTAGRKFCGWV